MRRSLIPKMLLVVGVAIGCLVPGTVFAQWFITDPEEPSYPYPTCETPLPFEPQPKPTFVTDPVEPHYPVPQYKTSYASDYSLDGYVEPKEKEVIAPTDAKSWYVTPDHWGWSFFVIPLDRPWDPYWDFPDYPWYWKGAIAPVD